MTTAQLQQALEAFDARNAEDPKRTLVDGREIPNELLYAQRMSAMLQRYRPDASEVLQLAARCQHICRWSIARDSYPMSKPGYHQWRNALKVMHATLAAEILRQVGYDEATIQRVAQLVGKAAPLSDPDMQTLEDVIVLVFVEDYLQAFVDQHPDYDTPKLLDILRKTLRKVSPQGREAALTIIRLPAALVPAITQVMQQEGWLAA
ncbi:MAG TPA: DUF4202 domain-containing protein [Methylovorus sp.]|jgi:hypothetical protein|nr:DUF4202 domain-containing protein [Methylovorus sp.]